jgi:prepilin-type N-terminal cleavage/methylation domain-containing protein
MKTSKPHSPITRSKGFTLIELLVVIGIIAALAAISFPVTVTLLKKARRVAAISTMESLETSINRFYSDYGYLPSNKRSNPPSWDDQVWTNRGDGSIFLRVITGSEELLNTKEKKYFSAPEAEGKKGGIVWQNGKPTYLYDKFGNGFGILLDYNYDETLKIPNIYKPEGDGLVKGRRVLIWNAGPDRKMGTKDDIKSWEN